LSLVSLCSAAYSKLLGSSTELPPEHITQEDIKNELINACTTGNLTVIQRRTEFGDERVKSLAKQNKYIILAAQNGHTDVIRFLVGLGANPKCDSEGTTPAAVASLMRILTLPDPNPTTGKTPLFIAAENGHVETVKALVSLGASPTLPDPTTGKTPLFIAAENGHVETVKTLVSLGASLIQPGPMGKTPLYIAAENGHAEVIKVLVELLVKLGMKQRINAVNFAWEGKTPLWIAAQNGHVEAVRTLLSSGANFILPDSRGITPLGIAAQNGHAKVVELLADQGASPSVPDEQGRTPLHAAAQNGHVEVINSLVRLGASLGDLDAQGQTPLHAAAQNGHVEVINSLVRLGASPNELDAQGQTPLHAAAQNGQLDSIKALVELGANLHIPDNQGISPLCAAFDRQNSSVYMGLLRLGAKPILHTSMKKHNAEYLSTYAVGQGYEEATGKTKLFRECEIASVDPTAINRIGEMLIGGNLQRANPNISDNEDIYAVMLACKAGNEELAMLLISAMNEMSPEVLKHIGVMAFSESRKTVLDGWQENYINWYFQFCDNNKPLPKIEQSGNASSFFAGSARLSSGCARLSSSLEETPAATPSHVILMR
jgi:ankyrin repeat protein